MSRESDFERRKADHLKIALDPAVQTITDTYNFEHIRLLHDPLPELNLEEVNLSTSVFLNSSKKTFSVPFFISSMTAGNSISFEVNLALARLSEECNILVGVGSQRREIFDPKASLEWKEIYKHYPNCILGGNIGLTQLVLDGIDPVLRMVDQINPAVFFIHTNPLQEALQREGTPTFKGGINAIKELVKRTQIPIIVKETGCGFSSEAFRKLNDSGIYAVDVSGFGGTHWGRIERDRFKQNELDYSVANTFANWGMSTVESLFHMTGIERDYEVWSSGGIRTGIDIVKSLAIGAEMVGLAHPWLRALFIEDDQDSVQLKTGSSDSWDREKVHRRLLHKFNQLKKEVCITLFCTGTRTPAEIRNSDKWRLSLTY